jgi:hypothetical protein
MRIWANLAAVSGAFALLSVPVHAAEQITLRNGFEITCHHHGRVNHKIRLYTNPGNENYIEVAPGEIAALEIVPDPPAPEPEAVEPANPVQARKETPSAVSTKAALTREDLGQMLAKAGDAHNVDRDLLASIVKAESNGNARAVSRAGAQGLMQLMPSTAADLGVQDSFHPEQNVQGGSTYLDELLTRYHDNLALALAAYNAGPGAVDKYHGIPPYRETRVYVARVIHEFNRRVKARQSEAARHAEVAGKTAASQNGKTLATSASANKPTGN